MSVAYYLFLFSVTFDPAILFDIKIHGLGGYLAAVSVAVRQIMPDHVLLRTPLGKLTNRCEFKFSKILINEKGSH